MTAPAFAGEPVRPPMPADERNLIERADLRANDLDEATAALYAATIREPRVAEFVHRVDDTDFFVPLADTPRVVVMPGAFHAEYPHTGADGSRVMELAKLLGWPAERVIVPSLAPMASNAAALVDVLAKERGRPTVVVSLSKGGADVKAAFERANATDELRDVRAWVSLSGIVVGTPLVAWLRARPLRCCGVRILLRLRGQRFAVLDEIRHAPETPLIVPPHIRAIHMAGFPLRRHLSHPWAVRGHKRLAPLGPNDGGGILLADVARLPGDLYPVWGADHYLRPTWDIRPLLLRILREAARPRP